MFCIWNSFKKEKFKKALCVVAQLFCTQANNTQHTATFLGTTAHTIQTDATHYHTSQHIMAPSHGALDALLMTNFSLDSCLSGWKRRREVEAEEDVTMQSLLDLIQNQKEAMASPRKKSKTL